MNTSQSRKQEKFGCSMSLSNLKYVFQGKERCTEEAECCHSEPSRTREVDSLTSHPGALSCSTRRLGISLVCECCSFRKTQTLEVEPGSLETLRASGTSEISSCLTCKVGFHSCQNLNSKTDKDRNFSTEATPYSHYSVSELVEGDFSRNVVEIICQTSWLKSKSSCEEIQTVLKVHCGQDTLAQFEKHRELIKQKARRSHEQHPRVIADGNELRKFHGTTIACSFGLDNFRKLCISDNCGLCKILRHGFSSEKEFIGGLGILTCLTSKRAFDSITIQEEGQFIRKAVIICRVIAGRICKPLDYPQKGLDSFVGKVDSSDDIEDLFLLNPEAILPCFVVILAS